MKNKQNIMEYQDKYDDLVKLLTEEVEIDGKKYRKNDVEERLKELPTLED